MLRSFLLFLQQLANPYHYIKSTGNIIIDHALALQALVKSPTPKFVRSARTNVSKAQNTSEIIANMARIRFNFSIKTPFCHKTATIKLKSLFSELF